MKHRCAVALPLQLFLLWLLPILILASERPKRSKIKDVVSSNAETGPEEEIHWIVRRDAVQRRREQRKSRRMLKLEKRTKKWKAMKSCKNKSKCKKQEAGRKKNLLGKKQDKDQLRKKGRKRQQKNKVKKTLSEIQRKVNTTACMTKLILYSRLNEKKASAISKQVKRIKGNDHARPKR